MHDYQALASRTAVEDFTDFFWELPKGLTIKEVRLGDIDKDGDMDVAVQLADGAIYGFHNVSRK